MNDFDFKFEDLIAVGPKVIIEIEPVKEKTEGGIVLPEKHVRREQDTISCGILVGIGPTAFEMMGGRDVNPKIGDKVFFVKFAGKEINVDDKYYRVLNDEDIYMSKKNGD